MNMVCYDVLESGFETGYIEFVENSATLADVIKREGEWMGPFNKKCLMNYFLEVIHKEKKYLSRAKDDSTMKELLKQYHETYLTSLAG